MSDMSMMRWDLQSVFPGDSNSPEITHFMEETRKQLQFLEEGMKTDSLLHVIQKLQNCGARLHEVGSYLSCLVSADVKDDKAKQLQTRLYELDALYQKLLIQLDAHLLRLDATQLETILKAPEMDEFRFWINERARRAKDKLPAEMEDLAVQLGIDGYRSWGDLYNILVGRMSITLHKDGKTEQLSMGQAFNRMSSQNRQERETIFQIWEDTWAKEADLFQPTLNHIAGYRLALYRARGWSSPLSEPLLINRMSQETLEAMWDTVERNKPLLLEYLKEKARLLGVDAPSWCDVDAPLGQMEQRFSYQEARDLIVEQFSRFNPEMGKFASQCFEKRWIEAEDRPGKRPGGFCTSFPISQETRIFMTFSGSAGNVSTLAHELGHAFHQHVMRGLPYYQTRYAMNVAETASTFAEAIVSDATMQEASDPKQRLILLADKVDRGVVMFMNIHARFLFETRFYEERKRGMLGVQDLNELMTQAQKDAFHNALSSYHPHFWASKLHFYITGTPFYNFPYTFGYLFSTGIYARAKAEGLSFGNKYVTLLRDTGRMNVENLAKQHLGVDLTQSDFWQEAANAVMADAKTFLQESSAFSPSDL
ncbi:M3 family oligoendopeptidase [Alicyclobacillus tolerans]|uniref:M3 family oligoendopeptidase n=1 Tax=Alicyclobacillus tolerans TaxID=90970 RepID=UPI003B78D294